MISKLAIVDLLTKELQAFKRTVTKVGTDTYAAEREQHDDMVLALAWWYREWVSIYFERASAQHRQRAAVLAAAEERANQVAIRNARAGMGR